MKKNKAFSSLIIALYSLAIGCELASVFNTGKLLEVLTLANLTELSSVGNGVIYSSLGIIIAFILPVFLLVKNKDIFLTKYLYLCLVPLFIFYVYDKTRPLTSFTMTFNQYVRQLYFRPQQQKMLEQMRLYEKDWIYQNTDTDNIPDLRQKNIVALFTEGLSLNMIDKFNQYPNLTPHISHFFDEGLWFDNYFNHTAATYRGIRGQLSSSYQYASGAGREIKEAFSISSAEIASLSKASIVYLSEILRQNGYHSYFICSHKSGDKMIKYLETLGFDKVFSAGDFKSEDNELTDGEIFYYLAELMKSGKLQEPYFIGFYNLGTHMGFSTRYTIYNNPYGPNNVELNNLYEFDIRFGNFINKVQQDPELKNKTAVILTTDHAYAPTSDKLETFHEIRTHFMAKVPFVLWYDGVVAERIDADGKNSLDFAPTLLHWLRINHAKNYFLGCSLYDENCPYSFQYIHNEGNTFFSTNPFRPLSENNSEDRKLIQKIRDFYNLSEYRVFKWNLR